MQTLVLTLTLFRIIAAPFVFIFVVFLGYYWLAFWLFNLAALTDFFDGKLARDFHVESRLGTILDPIGDKLLVLFTIISVLVLAQDNYVAIMSALLLAREFWVSALREFSSANNISQSTAVSFVAKTKTTFQFITLSLYLLGAALNLALVIFIANFTLFISVLLAYKSGIDYTLNTLKKLEA